jgi:predicted MFS family arabinose efflux permease
LGGVMFDHLGYQASFITGAILLVLAGLGGAYALPIATRRA